MPQYDDTNRGAIFKNDRRENDSQPQYKGSINAGGTDYWISMWVKKDKNGKLYMSAALTPKNAPAKPAQSEYAKQAQSSTKASLNAQAPADMTDDIPF